MFRVVVCSPQFTRPLPLRLLVCKVVHSLQKIQSTNFYTLCISVISTEKLVVRSQIIASAHLVKKKQRILHPKNDVRGEYELDTASFILRNQPQIQSSRLNIAFN